MKIAARQARIFALSSAIFIAGQSACTCGGGGGDLIDGRLAIEPDVLDFGMVNVNLAARKALGLKNIGLGELTITSVKTSDNLASEVGIEAVPARIEPGMSDPVDALFTPKMKGERDGEFVFFTSSSITPEVHLRIVAFAIEPRLAAEPSVIDFGRVVIGDTATATIAIENVGPSAIMIASVTPDVGTTPEFEVALSASRRLESGEKLRLSIGYAPRDRGFDRGRIVVSDDTHAPTRLGIEVDGEGVPAEIEIDPLAIDFSGLLVGERATRAFVIRNVGAREHSVARLALESGGRSELSISTSTAGIAPFRLAPGATRRIDVTYAPVDEIDDIDRIVIASSGLPMPAIVTLTGRAMFRPKGDLELSPSSLSFGAVEIGTTSSRHVTIANAGFADLHLTGALAIDPPSAPFSIADEPPPTATFVPGDSRSISVTYAPVDLSEQAPATLIVRSDDESLREARVALDGQPTSFATAHAEVDPASLRFVRVHREEAPTRTVLISSVGSATLIVRAIDWVDDAQGRFAVAAALSLPVAVPPLGSFKIPIAFRDSVAPTPAIGTLRIGTNDPDRSEIRVPVSAESATPIEVAAFSAELAWDARAGDLDLHVVEESGAFFDRPTDLCWCNPSPDWGDRGASEDDPDFARDAVYPPGPLTERIVLPRAIGRYRVMVHFFSDRGSGLVSTATLTMTRGSADLGSFSRMLARGLLWDVGTFDAATGRFEPAIEPLASAVRTMCY
jgi:HYDIN/CFA65/VesB family protein